ncbi:hypothetical protein C8J56DRAFT_1100231 [Mycena floridula]|nr:hypothetical protein C8J56DRAFT_1100231 [Mycena floridula]
MTDCKIITVDCEGKKLGTKIGKITSNRDKIGIHFHPQHPWVIQGCSPPLLDILESESVVKVMFGGRKDFSGLYQEQSVTLRNVLDMQIANITSQKIKGESTQDQLTYLGRGKVQGHPKSYAFRSQQMP